jgi:hypothetical protein
MSEAEEPVSEAYANSLPWNPRRLRQQAERYYGAAEGGGDSYASLLKAGRFGNQNRAKITGREQEGLIIKLLSLGNNLDCGRVAEEYNRIARIKGWPEIRGVDSAQARRKIPAGDIRRQARDE